jgi:hypothetical protein
MIKYRVCVFNEPRGVWRNSFQAAKGDAIRADLASYDETQREYFLAVPVRIEKKDFPDDAC